jgi:hypothetical protein
VPSPQARFHQVRVGIRTVSVYNPLTDGLIGWLIGKVADWFAEQPVNCGNCGQPAGGIGGGGGDAFGPDGGDGGGSGTTGAHKRM